jgi:hypothetical protein
MGDLNQVTTDMLPAISLPAISIALDDVLGGTARVMSRPGDKPNGECDFRHEMTIVKRATGDSLCFCRDGANVLVIGDTGLPDRFYLDITGGKVTNVLDDSASALPDKAALSHLFQMLCDVRRGLLAGEWTRVDRLEREAA